jgi:transposase
MVVRAAAAFDQWGQLEQGTTQLVVVERLRRGPGEREPVTPPPAEPGVDPAPPPPAPPPPSRWSLREIRATFSWWQGFTLSGVWRALRRLGLGLRSAHVQQYSPDPAYLAKEAHLLACLREAAATPDEVVALFLDEVGYTRWPTPAPDWALPAPATAPVADRAKTKQQLWRVIGALNALTGQVDYLDNYIIGRAKVSAFYRQVDQVYADARHIYLIQDNWSIHAHPDVQATLAALPRLEVVWLPTYAPWLNPIEKLWRWLKQDVLKQHRLAADWSALRQRVCTFLDQFASGTTAATDLLRYVGLLGDGKLAQACQLR